MQMLGKTHYHINRVSNVDVLTFLFTCMCGGVIIVGVVMLLLLGLSIPAALFGGGYHAPDKFLKFLYIACGFLILYAILGETTMPELYDDTDGISSSFQTFEVFVGYFLGVVIYHVMSHYWVKWSIDEAGKASWALGGVFLWFTVYIASLFLIFEAFRAVELLDQLPEYSFLEVPWEDFNLREIIEIKQGRSDGTADYWVGMGLMGALIGGFLVRRAVSLSRK